MDLFFYRNIFQIAYIERLKTGKKVKTLQTTFYISPK